MKSTLIRQLMDRLGPSYVISSYRNISKIEFFFCFKTSKFMGSVKYIDEPGFTLEIKSSKMDFLHKIESLQLEGVKTILIEEEVDNDWWYI